MTVGDTLVPGRGPDEGCPGLAPNPTSASKMFLDGSHCHVGLLGGEERRLITIHSHKWGYTCGRADQGVVCILDPGEVCGLGGRVFRRHTA